MSTMGLLQPNREDLDQVGAAVDAASHQRLLAFESL